MSQSEWTDEEYKKQEWKRKRGDLLIYNIYGVPQNSGQEEFEREQERSRAANQQQSGYNSDPEYQNHQGARAQGYSGHGMADSSNHPNRGAHNYHNGAHNYQHTSYHGYADASVPSNAYPNANTVRPTPVHSSSAPSRQLSLEYSSAPIPPSYSNRESPQEYAMADGTDSDSRFSGINTPYTTSSMSTSDRAPNAGSSGNYFDGRYDQNIPSPQGMYSPHANSRPPASERPKHHKITMYSSKNGQWHGLNATCDRGSDENWISARIVERLKLAVINGLPIKTTNHNGEVYRSGKIVIATWASEGRAITYENEFRVNDRGPYDVLFGRNLLSSPEINDFVDEFGENPAVVLVQTDVSYQEQQVIDQNNAAANAQSSNLAKKEKPIKPSNKPRPSDKHKESTRKWRPGS